MCANRLLCLLLLLLSSFFFRFSPQFFLLILQCLSRWICPTIIFFYDIFVIFLLFSSSFERLLVRYEYVLGEFGGLTGEKIVIHVHQVFLRLVECH